MTCHLSACRRALRGTGVIVWVRVPELAHPVPARLCDACATEHGLTDQGVLGLEVA